MVLSSRKYDSGYSTWSWIPDPVVKKAPDPGCGSATLGFLTCGDGGDILAVELVTAVHAVRRSVALPRAEHAVTARTPELPVLTKKRPVANDRQDIPAESIKKNAARKKHS